MKNEPVVYAGPLPVTKCKCGAVYIERPNFYAVDGVKLHGLAGCREPQRAEWQFVLRPPPVPVGDPPHWWKLLQGR